ncbi:TRAP transporter small permease [Vibrio mangrovi]|uniref:TRAP transporter small permease protein n=1 Tax=Vibrio mangrovi TaxID=474394 RepID=A0A1Y6IYT2_9VIBR|nr:TRAP transporter small permease [Vibrio mangrovi]MDW6002676.1 TRAP transporter small permease [Vibrio mangrovi]SMS02835.1 Tripartite ATP-independent periplasmic transporters, DctQ component [Vibrio mangrovi]
MLEQINTYIDRGLRLLLTLFMAVMIIAVVWQVFTRFVLNDPANFTDELSRYLLMWIGILGGAYTFSIKRHLALELLLSRYEEQGKLVLTIVTNLFVIFLSSVAFIYGGYLLVSSTLSNGQISPGIAIAGKHLLVGYIYLVVPISGALITYFSLLDILKAVYLLAGSRTHKVSHLS